MWNVRICKIYIFKPKVLLKIVCTISDKRLLFVIYYEDMNSAWIPSTVIVRLGWYARAKSDLPVLLKWINKF